MAVTGEQVYQLAMALIDEVDSNGLVTSSGASYRGKTPSILTQLQTELLPNTVTPVVITDLSQNLLLSDKFCLLVLPYGLAAHLMITENPNMAAFYNSRYEELKAKQPAIFEPITDVYDVLSGMM